MMMAAREAQEQQNQRNKEAKIRLAGKIQRNIEDTGVLAIQLLKGTKAAETLSLTTKNFVIQEHAIENSDASLKKMQLLSNHLHFQQEAMEKSAQRIKEVKDHGRSLINPRSPPS